MGLDGHGLPRIRAVAKWLWVRLLFVTGTLWWTKRWIRRHGVVVLTFHRVLDEEGWRRTCSPRGMLVSCACFTAFLKYASKSLEIISLGAGVPPWEATRKPRIAITFDDGWADNHDVAVAARSGNVPLTIFVCPERTDTTMPYWPELVVRHMRSGNRVEAEAEEMIASFKQLDARRRQIYWSSWRRRLTMQAPSSTGL